MLLVRYLHALFACIAFTILCANAIVLYFADELKEFLVNCEKDTKEKREKLTAGAYVCNLFAEKQLELMIQRDHCLLRIINGENLHLDRVDFESPIKKRRLENVVSRELYDTCFSSEAI